MVKSVSCMTSWVETALTKRYFWALNQPGLMALEVFSVLGTRVSAEYLHNKGVSRNYECISTCDEVRAGLNRLQFLRGCCGWADL